MKHIRLCMCLLVCVFFHTEIYAQEPVLPTGPAPAGAGRLTGPAAPEGAHPSIALPTGQPSAGAGPLAGPTAPEGARPFGPPSGQAKMGGGAPAPLYFAAGAISPDGKNLYVSFDRYLIHYALPELKLIQKVDLGLPVVPVTPSIFLSPDGHWIYIIKNGTLFQIDKTSFKIKTSEKLNP
jgi:hypothetical protein